MKKKGEGALGMSFGMIFSIILMIFFVIVAFMAIRYFFGIQECAKTGIFLDDFQNEIDKTWHSQSETSYFNGVLPKGIEYVCFADLSKETKGKNEKIGDELIIYENEKANLFFYPDEESCEIPYKLILHLDIESITNSENPYCFEVIDGKIKIQIKKEFNQRLVSIAR